MAQGRLDPTSSEQLVGDAGRLGPPGAIFFARQGRSQSRRRPLFNVGKTLPNEERLSSSCQEIVETA